jgi:hypothetical protein
MRQAIRLACGLAGATLLLLAGATAAFAADPLVTIDGSGGTSNGSAVADTGTSSATVTFGGNAPTTADGANDANGTATVTFGGNAPTTADGANDANGTATVTFGGNAPGAPATGGASQGLSQAVGLLSTVGSGGAPGGPGGSDGSGGEAAAGSGGQAAGGSGAGALPETSTEALGSASGAGFPILVIVLSLLVSWLVARRGSVRSAR